VSICVHLWITLSSTRAQTARFGDVYAVVGARIEVGDGRVIEKGTVVLRAGRIEAVGATVALPSVGTGSLPASGRAGGEVPVPPDAEVIQGDGLTVYPAFMDAHATKGLKLPEWQPNQDTPPDTATDAPPSMREANRKGVRPELRAVDYLALTDAELNPYRRAGFATALLAPSGGALNGVAALVELSGAPRRESVVRPEVALDATFAVSGTGYPQSLMGLVAHLRQTLLDARRHAALAARPAEQSRAPFDAALAALQPVLEGRMPVIFAANTEREILRAVAFADEFGLRPILRGGTEAWRQRALLAQRRIPVLVALSFGEDPSGERRSEEQPTTDDQRPTTNDRRPTTNDQRSNPTPETRHPTPSPLDPDDRPQALKQEQQRKWREEVANAARLHEAGVAFAFTTQGTKDMAEFRRNLQRAVEAGLPREAALRALTEAPARIFGVERETGSIQVGKTANLVVIAGDFTDPKARVRCLFVDRHKFDFERERSEEQRSRSTTDGR
jgi:imidazolonepropionase-like amidohydrolase